MEIVSFTTHDEINDRDDVATLRVKVAEENVNMTGIQVTTVSCGPTVELIDDGWVGINVRKIENLPKGKLGELITAALEG